MNARVPDDALKSQSNSEDVPPLADYKLSGNARTNLSHGDAGTGAPGVDATRT